MIVNLKKTQISMILDAIYDAIDCRRNHAAIMTEKALDQTAAKDQFTEAAEKDRKKVEEYKALADAIREETCQ